MPPTALYSAKWLEHWDKQLDRYIAGELHGVLFPPGIISGWIAQEADLGEVFDW
jgi:hypothetical protein